MKAPAGWSEPFQTPDFDEITLVLAGPVLVDHDGGTLEVPPARPSSPAAASASATPAGPREPSTSPCACPAFSPDSVHREDEA